MQERLVGIDGCRAGWLAVSAVQPLQWQPSAPRVVLAGIDVAVYATLADLWAACAGSGQLLIDMPVGLPDAMPRGVEPAARRCLPGRSSSVFSVPCRSAVYAHDYASACRLNRQHQGKALSLQAWHICPKIRQVDELLIKEAEARRRLKESHPEVAFTRLLGAPLRHSKRQAAGQAERLAILLRFWPEAQQIYENALGNWRRNQVARDDILDAMALLLTLAVAHQPLLATGQLDERGLVSNLIVPASYVSRE